MSTGEVINKVKRRGLREKAKVFDLNPTNRPTQQQHREHVHIDTIVARYRQTQEWNHVNPEEPRYANLDHRMTLQDAYEWTQDVSQRFMQFDAEIRDAADNDPVRFVEMMQNPEGLEALEAAGLAVEGRPSEANYLMRQEQREAEAEELRQRNALPTDPVDIAEATEQESP